MTVKFQRRPSVAKTIARTFLGIAWRIFTLTQCRYSSGGLVRNLTSALTGKAGERA